MISLRGSRRLVSLTVFALALAACGGSSSTNAADTAGSAGSADTVAVNADSTLAAAAAAPDSGAAEATGSVSTDGEWKVSTAQGGYRVAEVLQGQKTEAVGRTTAVTGSMTIAGTKATAANFEFDLTQLKSDSDRRDGQVQGRILQTAQFPTATFVLTQPIDFGAVPADGAEVAVKATGDLTLHGVTKPVTVDLRARVQGAEVQVLGNLPITFADWGIENPSIKPVVEVGETGTIEWVVALAKA